MKINEITRPQTIADADRILKQHGYKRLGVGSFGVAYQKRPDQVLKLFASSDTAYLKFIHTIKTANNPHFPKIFGNPIRINETYYGIKTEMLETIDLTVAYNVSSSIRKYIFNMQRGKQPTPETDIYKEIAPYVKNYEEFDRACKILVDLIKSDPDITLDIATRNIMFRNGTVVFSDPVASQTAMSSDGIELPEDNEQREITETIRKEKNKWAIYSKDGSKRLGEYDSMSAAEKRLRQIEFFKHQK